MSLLANAGLDVLVSVWHTPPSISESGACSGPPRNIEDYVGFIWEVIHEYGDYINSIEIWNEPNNRIKWNFVDHDPDWSKFARLLADGAREAASLGKQTVLGGIIPVDPHWLRRMADYGALDDLDVLAFHAFPGMWWADHPNWDWASHWRGWEKKVEMLRPFLEDREVWVTETGLATWDVHTGEESRFGEQQRRLQEALSAPVDRLYWYSMIDLAAERPCIEMTEDGRVEMNEYHMGLVSEDDRRKPAFYALKAALRRSDPDTGARVSAAR